ncbi:MAG: hypothetical protein H7Y61_17810, partial [Rhizobiales bacterium]|nr:hypothetical protein [Rhizobacter sp.]
MLMLLLGAVSTTAFPAVPDFGVERVSEDARYASGRVVATADNQQRPFAVVDKREARVYVFAAGGQLLGSSSALLGLAPGDIGIADIARRRPASLAPHERHTPSGR